MPSLKARLGRLSVLSSGANLVWWLVSIGLALLAVEPFVLWLLFEHVLSNVGFLLRLVRDTSMFVGWGLLAAACTISSERREKRGSSSLIGPLITLGFGLALIAIAQLTRIAEVVVLLHHQGVGEYFSDVQRSQDIRAILLISGWIVVATSCVWTGIFASSRRNNDLEIGRASPWFAAFAALMLVMFYAGQPPFQWVDTMALYRTTFCMWISAGVALSAALIIEAVRRRTEPLTTKTRVALFASACGAFLVGGSYAGYLWVTFSLDESYYGLVNLLEWIGLGVAALGVAFLALRPRLNPVTS